MTAPARIRVRVGRIVVDGLPVRSRDVMVEAFRQELVELIAQVPTGLGPARALHRVDATAADLTDDPRIAGRELALAVFGALRPGVRHG